MPVTEFCYVNVFRLRVVTGLFNVFNLRGTLWVRNYPPLWLLPHEHFGTRIQAVGLCILIFILLFVFHLSFFGGLLLVLSLLQLSIPIVQEFASDSLSVAHFQERERQTDRQTDRLRFSFLFDQLDSQTITPGRRAVAVFV